MSSSSPVDPHQLDRRLTALIREQSRQEHVPSLHRIDIGTSDGPDSNSEAPTPRRKRVNFTYDEIPSRASDPNSSVLNTPHIESGLSGGTSYFPNIAAGDTHSSGSNNSRSTSAAHPAGTPTEQSLRSVMKPPNRGAHVTFDMGETGGEEVDDKKRYSSRVAQEKAAALERSVVSFSAPTSRRNSWDLEADAPRPLRRKTRNFFSETVPLRGWKWGKQQQQQHTMNDEKWEHDSCETPLDFTYRRDPDSIRSGQSTPVGEPSSGDYIPRPRRYQNGPLGTLFKSMQHSALNPFPTQASHSQDSAARFMYSPTSSRQSSRRGSPPNSPPQSGSSTPTLRGYVSRHLRKSESTNSLNALINSASTLAAPGGRHLSDDNVDRVVKEKIKKALRPALTKKNGSSGALSTIKGFIKGPSSEELRIKHHIQDVRQRQRYIERLCHALMLYGAPTHRMEEFLVASARVLELDMDILHIPACTLISFNDRSIGTSEVKLIRVPPRLDLGKMLDVQRIYKAVVHDQMGATDATRRLYDVMAASRKFNRLVVVLGYAFACTTVGPFAFQARLIDLPVIFLLGLIVGSVQTFLVPLSEVYANVFEVSAAIFTAFVARGFGSMHKGELFCYSAIAQSSVAHILPGYQVLCAALEIQSRHMISGGVRMVFSIVYAFFIGIGMTIGSALFGFFYNGATSSLTCTGHSKGQALWPWVPIFTLSLTFIHQAKWKQMPWMLIVAFSGYIVVYWASQRFPGNAQISNALGAFVISVLANGAARWSSLVKGLTRPVWKKIGPHWYRLIEGPWLGLVASFRRAFRRDPPVPNPSPPPTPCLSPISDDQRDNEDDYLPRKSRSRWDTYWAHHKAAGASLAAATMIPAIFVQVPSGISVNGSLLTGLMSANEIVGNLTGTTTSTTAVGPMPNSAFFTVAFSVVQVAIGITVGLFFGTLIIYPLPKRRSGIFSF